MLEITHLTSKKLVHTFPGMLKYTSALLLILSGLYLLLQKSIPYLPYIQGTDIQKILLVTGEILILSITAQFFLKQSSRHFSSWMELLFLFLFMNCLLLLPFVSHYFDPAWAEIPGVRLYRRVLLQAASVLLPATAVSGIFSIKLISRSRFWLQQNIAPARSETTQALERQSPRDAPANPRNPAGQIAQWIRNDWPFWLLLILITAVGVYLRSKGLTDFVMDDETHHLSTATNILQGSTLREVEYRRSLYTVTAPVVLSFRLFGTGLQTAQWTSIFFNTLAVIPLTLLMRRINKTAAIAAAAVYFLNPWMIATARLVREYAYVPFYIYSAAVVMLLFYDAFPDRFVISRDARKLLKIQVLIPAALLLLFLYFMLFIDPNSTFKVFTAGYLCLALLLVRKLDLKHKHNAWLFLLPGAVAAFFLLNMDLLEGRYSGFTFSSFSPYFISLFLSSPLFFTDPVQQANFGYGLGSIILIALSLFCLKPRDQRQFTYPFAWSLFLVTLFVFLVFTVPGQKPRFATYIQIWYIPILAIGLNAAYLFLRRVFKPAIISGIGLFLLYFNLPHITASYLETTHYQIPGSGEDFFHNGSSLILEEYFSDPEPALSYLKENMQDGDVLLTTSFIERYFQWKGLSPDLVIPYVYDSDPIGEEILNSIASTDEGWIALDYERSWLWSTPLPLDEFDHSGRHVDWKGWKGDVNIYHWYLQD